MGIGRRRRWSIGILLFGGMGVNIADVCLRGGIGCTIASNREQVAGEAVGRRPSREDTMAGKTPQDTVALEVYFDYL